MNRTSRDFLELQNTSGNKINFNELLDEADKLMYRSAQLTLLHLFGNTNR